MRLHGLQITNVTILGLVFAASGCNTGSSHEGSAAGASQGGSGSAPISSGAPGGVPAPPSWPLGIPVPGFGIDERHTDYAALVGNGRYHDAGNGPYTHYVDNTAPNASDSNPGTAAEPLATIPLSLSPGDVVEIHGGPYSIGQNTVLAGTGSAAEPIFVRGVGMPEWTGGRVEIDASYMVVEGIEFSTAAVRLINGCERVAVRETEIHGSDRTGFHGGDSTDTVLYRNHIHHHQADNRHGISNGHGALRFWVVGNEVHHNAEDSFQCGHTSSPGAPPAYSEYIYIGGNTFYSDRENAVDLKWVKNVIISQNQCFSYESAPVGTYTFDDGSHTGTYSSGSDGSAILIGSDGLSEDVWIVFNEIYDNNRGVRIEDGAGVRIVGNTIRNTVLDGVRFEKEGGEVHVVGNTIHGAQNSGINQDWRENFTLFIHNNLVSDCGDRTVNIESGTVANASLMSHNLFWQSGAGVLLAWGSGNAQSYNTTADLLGFAGGSDNQIEDPRFADPTTGDLRLLAGSPALTGGQSPDALTVYSLFETQHPGAGGIRYNADGEPLTNNSGWPIGSRGAR